MSSTSIASPRPRDSFLDYGKALLLVWVALNHVAVPFPNNGSITMLFFFFVSGYVYSGRRSVRDAVKLRFKAILVPFWVATAVLGLLEIPRALYLGYGGASVVGLALLGGVYGSALVPELGSATETLYWLKNFHPNGDGMIDTVLPLTCHLWFLPAMFVASTLFYVYAKKVRKNRWNDAVAIVALCVLAWTETLVAPEFPYGFGRGCWGCAAMIAGLAAKEFRIFADAPKFAPVFLGSAVVAVAAGFAGAADVMPLVAYYGEYGLASVFISFVGGVGGSIVLCYLMRLLERVLKGHDRLLCFAGRNTMPTYLWHMPVLNVLSFALLALTGTAPYLNDFKVAVLPPEWVVAKCCVAVLAVAVVLIVAKALHRTK